MRMFISAGDLVTDKNNPYMIGVVSATDDKKRLVWVYWVATFKQSIRPTTELYLYKPLGMRDIQRRKDRINGIEFLFGINKIGSHQRTMLKNKQLEIAGLLADGSGGQDYDYMPGGKFNSPNSHTFPKPLKTKLK